MTTPAPRPEGLRLTVAVVLRVREDHCDALVDGEVAGLRYAPGFPTPRVERVSPGHLVAVATRPGLAPAVVWRWYDAVVVAVGADEVTLWEPAHGEVVARPRPGRSCPGPGRRAWASAGLPGADWWVNGAALEPGGVDLDEVAALYTEHGLWDTLAG